MATTQTSGYATMIHHLPSFVSSSAYYGYVPPPPPTAVPPVDVNMEVEVAVAVGGQHPAPRIPPRKRGSGIDEIAGYMPRFKRFREGHFMWSEEHGLAKMYNGSSLLRLSPAADCDMACPSSEMSGNLKFQSRNNNDRCQELEDMLMLTHGCNSYHHSWPNQANDEAEF